jgi:hypothetical protein
MNTTSHTHTVHTYTHTHTHKTPKMKKGLSASNSISLRRCLKILLLFCCL